MTQPVRDTHYTRPTEIIEGIVERTNPDRKTYAVRSAFGRRFFDEVQAASPYLHYDGGAGDTRMFKRGTRVVLCIPSDGSPPLIIACIANFRPPVAGKEDPKSTPTQEQEQALALVPSNAPSFDNNREPLTDGDMVSRGADGQGWEILEGVGARAMGSALNWTLWEVSGRQSSVFRSQEVTWAGGHQRKRLRNVAGVPSYEDTQVWRHLKTDLHASLRVRVGGSFLGEPDAPEKKLDGLAADTGMSVNDTVLEWAQAPSGFASRDGEPAVSSTRNNTTFRALLLKGGGLLFWLALSLVIRLGKHLKIVTREGITLETDGLLVLKGKKGVVLQSEGVLKLDGPSIHAGAGSRGVCGAGDTALVSVPLGTQIAGFLNSQPFTGTFNVPGTMLSGTFVSPGSPTLRMP